MLIRTSLPSDHPSLLELWRRSVSATHAFLTKQDILDIEKEVAGKYLPTLELWVYESAGAALLGFMGLDGSKVEMLFAEPDRRGQGIGSSLLNHARQRHGTLTLDVNEQNPKALGFYLHYGFKEIGRSAADSAGRPFPLIHLRLD
jgi:putative acetyltransferase